MTHHMQPNRSTSVALIIAIDALEKAMPVKIFDVTVQCSKVIQLMATVSTLPHHIIIMVFVNVISEFMPKMYKIYNVN